MLKTIKGDLIKLAEGGMFDVIIHGCNCFHAMGGGIAKQLANRYPIVKETDRQTEFGARDKLGTSSQVIVKSLTSNHLFVVKNVYTQYYWSYGKDVFEYEAFQKFLNYTKELIFQSYSSKEGRFFGSRKTSSLWFPSNWSRSCRWRLEQNFKDD